MRTTIAASNQRVEILLSTYNGARFLGPLLESLASQQEVSSRVLVRDDGSSDGTVELLRGRAGVELLLSDGNLGVFPSYFTLLQAADPDAAYYAFCDQDDVWEADKLSRALRRLSREPGDRPLLYCSRQKLVDAELKPLGLSRLPRRGPAFGNALVENIATGCTVVINGAAREAFLARRPETVVMHDWWAYIITSALGQAIYDPEPRVLYRQHGGNVIGATTSRRARWTQRLQRFRAHGDHAASPILWSQARELEQIHGERLGEEQRRLLRRFIDRRESVSAGLRYALRPGVFRQRRLDDWILRALMATRRI